MDIFIQFVISSTLKAGVIILVVLMIQFLFRRWLSPRWNYLLWLLVFIRLLIPETPNSDFSIFNIFSSVKKDQKIELIDNKPNNHAPTESKHSFTVSEEVNTELSNNNEPHLSSWEIYFYIWSCGSFLLLFFLVRRTIYLYSQLKSSQRIIDRDILELLEDIKAELNVTAPFTLIRSSTIDSPALLGFIRPKILLPVNMPEELSKEEMRFVFIHELSHFKRFDIPVNWFVTAGLVIHWFNPFVWLAYMNINTIREEACDEAVISHIGASNRVKYGLSLIDLVSPKHPERISGMIGILENHKHIKRRIKMIHQFQSKTIMHNLLAFSIVLGAALVSLTEAKAKEPQIAAEVSEKRYDNVLDEISIPRVSMKNRSFDFAIDFTQIVYKRLHPNAKTLNVFLMLPKEKKDWKVSADYVNIPTGQLLIDICSQLNLKCSFDSNFVWIEDLNEPQAKQKKKVFINIPKFVNLPRIKSTNTTAKDFISLLNSFTQKQGLNLKFKNLSDREYLFSTISFSGMNLNMVLEAFCKNTGAVCTTKGNVVTITIPENVSN